jgi:organic radical activating enzyme
MIERVYLEFYLTYHCNLKCAHCSVGSPYIDPTFYTDFEQFKSDIDNLAKYMRVHTVRLLGGEPTLHPDIVKYMRYIHESDLTMTGVNVATNGIALKTMPQEFWDIVHKCNISEYQNTGINYQKLYQWLDDNNYPYNKVHELLRDSCMYDQWIEEHGEEWVADATGPIWNFRDLELYEESSPEVAQEVFTACPSKDTVHAFMNGKYYNCGFSTHRNLHYKSIGVDLPYDFRETDGIAIDENFTENYYKLVNSKEININACRWCKGYGQSTSVNSDWIPHRQLTNIEIQEIKQ